MTEVKKAGAKKTQKERWGRAFRNLILGSCEQEKKTEHPKKPFNKKTFE